MNAIPQTAIVTDDSSEALTFLKRHPRLTQILRRLHLVQDSPIVAARTVEVAQEVTTVLDKTSENNAINIIVEARKAFNLKGVTMSAADQDALFALCNQLYLKEDTVVFGNPLANIGPLKKYLPRIGTNVAELETLCGITKGIT